MLVKVAGYAGAGDFTLIHADVETVTSTDTAEHLHCLLSKKADFGHLFFGSKFVGCYVTIGADQQVTGIVWKQIQNYVGVFTTMNN